MPASGARSGTRPSRFSRGAGDGRLVAIALTCGHTTDEQPVMRGASYAIYMCPNGCGLAKRAPRRATTERKEERRDSYGDRDAQPERPAAAA